MRAHCCSLISLLFCLTLFACATIMKTSAFFVVILLGFHLVVADNATNNEEAVPPSNTNNPIGDIPTLQMNEFGNVNPQVSSATKCECAVFSTENPAEGDNPILTQAPMSVSCDFAGEQNCKKLCSVLAEGAKERGPQLLCSTLGHYDKLKASVHSRICDAKTWTYTGLTAPTEICCHDHHLIDCKDQVDNPPTNQL